MNYNNTSENVECPICMDCILDTKNRVTTECGHCFHTNCLMTSVAHNGFGCPYCRTSMAEEIKDDDEDEDDDDDDCEDEDNDEDEDAASDSTDSDNEKTNDFNLAENDVIQIGESFDVKILKINISEYNENINDEDIENDLDSNAGNLDDLDDLDELAGSDSASSKSVVGETNTEEFLSLDCNNVDELENLGFNNEPFTEDKISLFDLKSINMSSLEEESKESIDFKKLSIPKLRSIVSERGLSIDVSKLKKNELLKLLEVE